MSVLSLAQALASQAQLHHFGIDVTSLTGHRQHPEVLRWINTRLFMHHADELTAVSKNESLLFLLLHLLKAESPNAWLQLGAVHNHLRIKQTIEKQTLKRIKSDLGEALYSETLQVQLEGSPQRDIPLTETSLTAYGVDLVYSWWLQNKFDGLALIALLHPYEVQPFDELSEAQMAMIAKSLQDTLQTRAKAA